MPRGRTREKPRERALRYHHGVTLRESLRWAVLACAVAACSTNSSVIGGPTDAGGGALDVAMDLATPDVGADAGSTFDAADAVDAPIDAGFRCAQNADCVGHAEGPACDTASGRCVGCVPSADTCAAGQFCPAGGNTCAPGCRNDDGCTVATPDGGTTNAPHCDVAAHHCVQCLADAQCPSGTLCVGNLCVTGCTVARGCPGAQACCDGACVDTQSNTAACGACGRRCGAPNGVAGCMNVAV